MFGSINSSVAALSWHHRSDSTMQQILPIKRFDYTHTDGYAYLSEVLGNCDYCAYL